MSGIDTDSLKDRQEIRDERFASERIRRFIERWSPENPRMNSEFSAELIQIVQRVNMEATQMLQSVIENFLNIYSRPMVWRNNEDTYGK